MSKTKPPFFQYLSDAWVTNALQTMSLEQKIGQLFQVAAFSNKGAKHTEEIKFLIKNYHIGGLTFFQGNPQQQAELTNTYQSVSKIPLFVNMDAEWGLAMRLQGGTSFPYQMALGAISENELIKEMAGTLARQCKSLGLHSPLAPVADVNSNPANPVISFRSFGENEKRVASKAIAYMEGLQSNNILAVAKHFPGHGDTDIDSHFALPTLMHAEERIRNVELYPFQQLIDEGLGAIMTAHIHVPAFDDRLNMPATLSTKILTDLLQREMGFEGLIISDALDMKGITRFYSPGEADKLALMAGNDIITNSVSVPDGVSAVKKAIACEELNETWLDAKVKKILAMKRWLGLHLWKPVESDDFSLPMIQEADLLNKKLAEKALTILTSEDSLADFALGPNCASLHIQCMNEDATDPSMEHHLKLIQESGGVESFIAMLQKQTGIKHSVSWSQSVGEASLEDMLKGLANYQTVVFAFHGVNVKPANNFNIPVTTTDIISRLDDHAEVILVFFGNAYALDKVRSHHKAKAVVLSYQENQYMHKAATNWLSNGLKAPGCLPVTINENFPRQDIRKNRK